MNNLIDPKRKKPDDDGDDGSAVREFGYPTPNHDKKEHEKKEDKIPTNQNEKEIEAIPQMINDSNLYYVNEEEDEEEEDEEDKCI